MRTRAYFLDRLKTPEQIRIVKSWMQENKQFVADLEREVETFKETESAIKVLALQNLLCLAQARQEWLRKLLSGIREGVLPPTDCSTTTAAGSR